MSNRYEVVSFRCPPELVECVEELAEQSGVSNSRMWRMLAWHGVEANTETLVLSAQIDKAREEIKDRARPIDQAGGFAGRVAEDFEQRFKAGYQPKWLASKAESYREEARMLEQKVREHPDAPAIEDGELVEEVENELRDALEALDTSNWHARYENRYKKFGGVDDAEQRRQMYVQAVKNAMETRQDVEMTFKSTTNSYSVVAEDLKEDLADDLPHGVDRGGVAEAANRLADMGVELDAVEDALREHDPRVWDGQDGETEAVQAGDDDSTEPDAEDVSADGGRSQDDRDTSTADPNDDYVPKDARPDRTLVELFDWTADVLMDGRLSGKDVSAEGAKRRIESATADDAETWQSEIMDRTTLTLTDLIELADDYNDERKAFLDGERDEPPQRPVLSDTAADAEVVA